jgi:hypothetical protein
MISPSVPFLLEAFGSYQFCSLDVAAHGHIYFFVAFLMEKDLEV